MPKQSALRGGWIPEKVQMELWARQCVSPSLAASPANGVYVLFVLRRCCERDYWVLLDHGGMCPICVLPRPVDCFLRKAAAS